MKFKSKIITILIFILTLSFNFLVFSKDERDLGPLQIQFSNVPLKISSFGPTLNFSFGSVTQINVLNSSDSIKQGLEASDILIVNGKEYYISWSSGLKISDSEKQFDIKDLEQSMTNQDDESRFTSILSMILSDFTSETRDLEIILITFTGRCGEGCWRDQYCKDNCHGTNYCKYVTASYHYCTTKGRIAKPQEDSLQHEDLAHQEL